MSLPMIQLFKGITATPTQKLVGYMLADAHNGETGRCDLSVASLMRLTCLGERAVQQALKGLESGGHLSRCFRTGTSTQYCLHPRTTDTPVADAPPQQVPRGGAADAPPPPHDVHPTPAADAPNPERTGNRTGTEPEKADRPPEVEEEECDELKARTIQEPKAEGRMNVRPSRPDWRSWNRTKAAEADALPLPPHVPPAFHAAWQRWRAYRTARACDARIASEAVAWTLNAAEACLRECERAAETLGWEAVAARIDTAIAGSWQGLNLHHAIGRPPQHASSAAAANAAAGPPSALQSELGTWFGRPPGAHWSADEHAAWAALPQPVDPRSDDWLALRWFYQLEFGRRYRKQSVLALLRAWTSEIDRAKNHDPELA